MYAVALNKPCLIINSHDLFVLIFNMSQQVLHCSQMPFRMCPFHKCQLHAQEADRGQGIKAEQ